MSSAHTENAHPAGEKHEGMTKRSIWNVFFLLAAITAVEFYIALYWVYYKGMSTSIANPFYIFLTLVKAGVIIAFFMHLKFEKKALIYAIAVPVLFIIGLILVLTNESHYWIELRNAL